jgi:superfamily II DNA helicase RecQ
MHNAGLATLVINADTNHEAHKTGRNLWTEARERIRFILVSPEQMRTTGFFRLLNDSVFEARVCVLGVDECHLIYWWGQKLRPDFRQINLVRSRLPIRGGMQIPVVGLTATLRVGDSMDCILLALAFKPGSFHLIRRSNLRPDIQIILREMQSGMGSEDFPELDWIISGAENTVIFCKSIALGFRVTTYLWHRAKNLPNRKRQIRMYNSLNWPDYNTDTLSFLEVNSEFSITVATDTLSVGWYGKHIHDVILLSEPNDADEFVQKIGHI